MSRHSNGSGSIQERADGRWVGKLRIDGHRYYVYGKAKAEAQAKLKELQAQSSRGTLRPPQHLTVAEYLDWWLEVVAPTLKPSTVASYQTISALHVKPDLGRTKLDKLAPTQLAWLYGQKLKAGLSPRRVQMIHRLLSKALGDAVKLD